MKNWNNIGTVTVESRGGIKKYNSLYEAVYWSSWGTIQLTNNHGYRLETWVNVYLHDETKGRWLYRGDEYLIRDDLGLVIPHWKIVEVWETIPRNIYGYPIASYRKRKRFKFRNGPVECIWNRRGGKHGKGYVWQAIKADYFDRFDEELKEYNFKRRHYKDRFDDFTCWERRSNYGERNWKNYRKNRWK